MTPAKILDKIKKLQKLADQNASEGERNNALEAMQKLLDEHNLSLAEIEATPENNPFATTSEVVTSVKLEKWSKISYIGVGILFDCLVFIRTNPYLNKNGNRSVHENPRFIGTVDNIFTAKEMALYVTESIKAEAKNYAKHAMLRRSVSSFGEFEQILASDPSALKASNSQRNRAYKSFCLGAAQRVHQRCLMMVAARKAANAQTTNSTGTSLAVIKDKFQENNREFVKNNIPDVRYANVRKSAVEINAFQAGINHGNKINMSRQLSRGNPSDPIKSLPMGD